MKTVKVDENVEKMNSFVAGYCVDILSSYACRDGENQGIEEVITHLRRFQKKFMDMATEEY